MEVEVDLFSGRPNPRFRLTHQTAAELMRRIATLTPLGQTPAPGDGLGYRGLRVEPGSGEPGEPFEEIRISDGVVVIRERRGAERSLADPGRALERWLIDVGAASLDPEIVAVARQHLGPARE